MLRNNIIEIFGQTWPTLLICMVIIISLRVVYLIKNKEKIILHRELITIAFITYVLCLFYVVTFKDESWGINNFIPFKEILRYDISSEAFYKNIIGNMFMFIPLGFFAGYILKLKDVKPALLVSFIVSLSIECTQLFIGRVFDIDDIMLNVVGGTIGYFLYVIINFVQDHLPKILQNVIIYNIVIITTVILLIMYLLKIINISGV